jgi:hypothetical protein
VEEKLLRFKLEKIGNEVMKKAIKREMSEGTKKIRMGKKINKTTKSINIGRPKSIDNTPNITGKNNKSMLEVEKSYSELREN